jgi:hypothetical protein
MAAQSVQLKIVFDVDEFAEPFPPTKSQIISIPLSSYMNQLFPMRTPRLYSQKSSLRSYAHTIKNNIYKSSTLRKL